MISVCITSKISMGLLPRIGVFPHPTLRSTESAQSCGTAMKRVLAVADAILRHFRQLEATVSSLLADLKRKLVTRFITHVAVLFVNKTNVIKAVCSMLVH